MLLLKREGRAVKKIIDAIMDPSLNEEQHLSRLLIKQHNIQKQEEYSNLQN